MSELADVVAFGQFRFDFHKRTLTRSGEWVALTPAALELLRLLVMNAGELVRKDEILDAVWPHVFVSEGCITQNIFTLRRALGDPACIQTVPRRGYRFAARVEQRGKSNDD